MAKTSVSENNAVSDKIPDDSMPYIQSEPTDTTETDPIQDENTASETKLELSALHIGQIKKGETLPAPADDKFIYDLPISIDPSDNILLFVNYSLNTTPERAENGMLVWSILRGKKDMTPGSTSLINEADDWTGFETVPSSPLFTIIVDKEEKSDHYNMAELAARDTTAQEIYDYYIRAAYYPNAEYDADESFYAAVTLPFLPPNDDDNTVKIQEDMTAAEYTPSDSLSDNTIAAEDTEQADVQDEEAVETVSVDMDSSGIDLLEEETAVEQTLAESVSENSQIAAESLSPLSEEEVAATRQNFGVLTVNTKTVTLHPGETVSVSATLASKDPDAAISWESQNKNTATVKAVTEDKNGITTVSTATITAVADGDAQIVAKYGDTLASVKVTVVPKDDSEVYDLSEDIWIAGFQKESEGLVYTGQKITQDLRVYHKETLLKEKTDYTLTYKNNVNAAVWNSSKAPSVTITLKGQYQGSMTLYYTIHPANIENDNVYIANSQQVVTYSKTLKIPNPALTLGKKKLTINKDFVCDYTPLLEELEQKNYKKGDSYEPGKIYHYTVNGKGNFTGSISMQLVVVDKTRNFNSATVTLSQKQYAYHGTALSKEDVTISKVTLNKTVLDKTLYDYEVYAEGINNAYLMVYPTAAGESDGYRGFKKVALKLVGDRNIKSAALGDNWQKTLSFSQKTVNEAGGIFQEKTGVLTFKTETGVDVLTEGQDYTVKYTNAKKVGTVTVTFTGKGRYKGTLSKKYKILPNIDKDHFTIRWKNVTNKNNALEIAYQKGGAVPSFVLMDQDNNILKTNTNYTVKLTNNKKPGAIMNCVITGKGNYKGYTETVQLTVTSGDISQGTLSVSDKPYSTKANAWKSKVTVKDVNGKTLAAGTDYEKQISYSYTDMENEQLPAAGTTVTVTVTGKGCYAGSEITGSYRIYKNSISKLLVAIDTQEYTGKAVTLSPEAIHVYASSADKKKNNELQEPCYAIVTYQNNIKAGTAKVSLRGIGDYGGTKTYSFKIAKKAYSKNSIKGISLDNKTLTLSILESQDETSQKGFLTATITSQNDKKITNPTVIWSSSNSAIATVEETANNTTGSNGTATTASSTVRIQAKKEGSVTITAISQDGNKKATCKVTITNKPIFTENGQTIKENVDATHQLNLQYIVQTNSSESTTPKWASSNPNVVSVDQNGVLTMKKAGVALITVSVSKYKFTGQCYAVAIDPNEQKPEGKILTYTQEPGCTDDTPYINKLLRAWEWDYPDRYEYIYFPAGVYHIDASAGGNDQFGKYKFGGIILTDNQKLIMSPSALLVALGNNQSGSHIIWAFGRDNISISGGQIIGERKIHTGSGGEWGHGIQISGCTNVTIENVDISQCWGDGIYLGYYDGQNKYSSNVTITNCNLHHNRRNNLSITDASNVTVSNCQFNNASGTDPQYGIDIEPNRNRTCSNVTISNSTFQGNAGGTIQILGQLNAHVNDVKIENCTGDKKPVIWQGFGGSVSSVTQEGNKW